MGDFLSTDGIGWAAVGGYYALENALKSHSDNAKIRDAERLINVMSDRALEDKIRNEISRVGDEKFDEIWRYIERFKRENPHIANPHGNDSYWKLVGKERFPFTNVQFAKQACKVPNKSEKEMVRTYFGWTITLLMNTQNKYSVMEATRIAFRDIFGNESWSWTREYG